MANGASGGDDQRPGSEPPASDAARRPRRWPLLVAAAVVVVAVVVAVVVTQRASDTDTLSAEEINAQIQEAVTAGIEEFRGQPPDSALVYQAILPSVVVVRADRATAPTSTPGAPNTNLGTGVVVNDQGAILTARHVVADARAITVIFADGTEGSAQIDSEDPETDIAVLVPDRPPEVIVPAVLGGGAAVGESAYAVGTPLGLTASMSAGVISGLGRSIPLADGTTLDGLIQFDTAVNPGSSGGPLLNRAGQVIGIITGLANPSGQNYFIGIGFAVPIGTAGGTAGAPAQ